MTKVLAQDLHHTPVGREVIVNRDDFFYPGAILDIEEISKTIRIGLIRTEETEITLLGVFCKHISHHLAQQASLAAARSHERVPLLDRSVFSHSRCLKFWRKPGAFPSDHRLPRSGHRSHDQ